MGGCSAFGCTNRSENGFQMFSFPSEPRKSQWEAAVRRLDGDRQWISTKGSRLCHVHFADDAYEKLRQDGKQKLRCNAVPTIFSYKPAKRVRPSLSITKRAVSLDANNSERKKLKMQAPHDHMYCKTPNTPEDSSVMQDHSDIPSTGMLDSSSLVDEEPVGELVIGEENCSGCEKLQKREDNLVKLLSEKRQQIKTLGGQLNRTTSKVKGMFTNCQLVALGRSSTKGVTWDSTSIKKALQIRFSSGATGYNLLIKQGQPLPSLRTLQRRMKTVTFKPGLLHHIFAFMKLKVKSMTEEQRFCCLTLDECAITPSVEYDVNNKSILGSSTFPDCSQKATHGLVFMLSGLTTRWKQTVGYHYTGNSVDGKLLRPMVFSIIERASSIGLEVISITSDMGASNRALWKRRDVTISHISHPSDPNRRLYVLADIPHLVKNLRTMLCNHGQIELDPLTVQKHQLPSSTVKVSHIINLVGFQEEKDLLLAPKLNKSLLTPGYFNKMKVGQALEVFSHAVSTGLCEIVDRHGFPVELKTTAWFIEQGNHWFDLACSRSAVMALSKHKPEKYDEAVKFLKEFVVMISACQFGSKSTWKPVQSGIALSTKSLIGLSEDLLGSCISFLLTSRLSQDCLESLFSVVRMKNPVPTPLEFKHALKIISISQFLQENKSSSYIADENNYMADFLTVPEVPIEEDLSLMHEVIICNFASDSVPNDELSALYHLAGYCVQSQQKKDVLFNAQLAAILQDGEDIPAVASFTLRKEYISSSLVRCSTKVFELCQIVETAVRQVEPLIIDLSNPHVVIRDNCYAQSKKLSDLLFPSCHNMKSKLVDKYISVRLQLLCKKLRSAASTRRSGAAMGSKSMAMRELASSV